MQAFRVTLFVDIDTEPATTADVEEIIQDLVRIVEEDYPNAAVSLSAIAPAGESATTPDEIVKMTERLPKKAT